MLNSAEFYIKKKFYNPGAWACIMIRVAQEESHQNFVTVLQVLIHLA